MAKTVYETVSGRKEGGDPGVRGGGVGVGFLVAVR